MTTISDLADFSDKFSFNFETSRFMRKGIVTTAKAVPICISPVTLGQIAIKGADGKYYLSESEEKKFAYLRGSKKIPRKDANGFEYMYSEGAMSHYDDLSLPGRTMLTFEGTVNRSTHILKDPVTNKMRYLTPVECERLNQFPDNWTNTGMPDKRRDESTIREDFIYLKMMLFVFKKIDGVISFDKICFWNAPNKVVDGEIKKMHEECANLVRNGNAFYFDGKGKILDKFPKEDRNGNGVCHIRPHARKCIDKYVLPIPDKKTSITEFTKQSFWFNKDFLEMLIRNSNF